MPRQRTTMNTSNDLASPPTGVDARGKQDGTGDGVDILRVDAGDSWHLIGLAVAIAHAILLIVMLDG